MNLILLLLSIAVFLSYTLMIYFRYGITSSISSSIHYLPGLQKSFYSFFILGIGLPMMIVSGTALGFLAGAFLCFDFAAVATHDDKIQNFIHTVGADVGMGLGVLMLGINYNQWWLTFIFVLFTLISMRWKYKNHTWWIECFAFLVVITGLLIEKILT